MNPSRRGGAGRSSRSDEHRAHPSSPEYADRRRDSLTLLEALAASGGNTAAFAREHGLAAWKLYEAQRVSGTSRPRRGRRRVEPEFVRVEVVEERPASSAPRELVVGSGHRFVIPAGFDERTLRRVMGVLASC